MDSLTGTAVNNVFVTVEYPLQLGDTFTVGDTVLLVQDPDAPDPPEMRAENPKSEIPSPKPVAPSKQGAPTGKPQAAPPSNPPSKPVITVDLPDRLEQLTGYELSHYRVGTLLFRGRTGFVFNAQDMKSHKPVALKVMPATFAQEERNREQFTKAMKLAIPLRHPNVVSVVGAGKTGPYCWMAMELVKGESLTAARRHIGVAGSLDWRRALRVAIYLARGLTYLHEQKAVYRNIGPQNI